MDASPVEQELTIDHARFQRVWASIFTRSVVADCMDHQCEMEETHTRKLDACCQYGCDVDLFERDAILARAHQIRPLLRGAAEPLFDSEVDDDPDYPSGQVVRTAVHDGGCIFLAHDRRGCAIHRAAREGVSRVLHLCGRNRRSYEQSGVAIARQALDNGAALDKLEMYRDYTRAAASRASSQDPSAP